MLTAPAISLTLSPEAGIIPLASHSLELSATVHSSVKGPAQGHVHLELPPGWHADPAVADFATAADGEVRTVRFRVTPSAVAAQPYRITAVADYAGKQYRQGFETVGYTGLRPYPYYRDATYETTGVDVKVAPNLHVAYVTGTGDDVAKSLVDLGVHVTFLSAADIETADLSAYDTVVLGIRAYAARPELRTANARLLNYVKAGGIVLVQYQTPEFRSGDAPYPLSVPGDAEKVVEEDSVVSILTPEDPLLNFPNRITAADFNGWVEERGHGFPRSWDPRGTAPSRKCTTPARTPKKAASSTLPTAKEPTSTSPSPSSANCPPASPVPTASWLTCSASAKTPPWAPHNQLPSRVPTEAKRTLANLNLGTQTPCHPERSEGPAFYLRRPHPSGTHSTQPYNRRKPGDRRAFSCNR